MDQSMMTHHHPACRIFQTMICTLPRILAYEKIISDQYAMILLEVHNTQCNLSIYIFIDT